MHQLTQQLKSGKMEVVEVPLPQLQPEYVLVRNHFSVISPGTEGKTAEDARKGYLAKAKSRKKEVVQVLKLIKTQGLKDTYKMVMNKLEALSPLGYSSAGEVIAVGAGVKEFKVGDLVACGGGSLAVHADVVVIPKNLCAKVASEDLLMQASFTTIASIALQGIRQAKVEIGSKVVIVGLGLIGIITQKLLKAAGIDSIGVDIDESAVATSKRLGFKAFNRTTKELNNYILNWAQNQGADAVLICAATQSDDPINFAGEIARRKANVVIVGAVPTGFDRKNYYQKELEIKMSCSYGPGRYDTAYENNGLDYPYAYVRWTEQRNMQAVCDLLANRSITFNDLVTHRIPLEESPNAYTIIVGKTEPYLGIVIEYDTNTSVEYDLIKPFPQLNKEEVQLNTGIIGAGSFARNVLLQQIQKRFKLFDITSGKGNSALSIARKYNIGRISQNPNDVIANPNVGSVFVLTRHNLHAKYIMEALNSGKNAFVEKPLCISVEQLKELHGLINTLHAPPLLMVGFNRRFAPFTQLIKNKILPDLPLSINMRINAGALPSDHWVNDPEIGGGRLIGEGCHFIDLAYYLAGSDVERVSATSSQSVHTDTFSVQLSFKNGSIANIAYFSNGAKTMSKELIEVFTGSNVYVIDDFVKFSEYSAKGAKKKKLKKQDKGHANEIERWAQSQLTAKPAIPIHEVIHTHWICFAADCSIREKRTIWLEDYIDEQTSNR